MWLSKRKFLLGALVLGLGACGFTPVYGPQGTGNRLLGRIALEAPKTPNDYAFNARFEERMGRASSGPYLLSVKKTVDQQDLGSTSTGNTTRYRLLGRASYSLTDAGTKAVLIEGQTDGFTGYSTTGSTVATLAAERAAEQRLMVILADQVIDKLILQATDLPE
ncbi:LPS assembly lipoprotein LptE [Tropicibacter oceani]|uniref:LPS assembly lipoprotein LptE n=1 Tax=Tropicibacter oceani TaxID=3058420 RepID=A0ABY8QMI4_9RHOB|nr:LPS assembly lipoprotein LptE [Tropicibacter oceani]WGW04992.1 LPS assembly lipoprotein LptE [Tropicibacter oceani]